jgi:hypothetical protein
LIFIIIVLLICVVALAVISIMMFFRLGTLSSGLQAFEDLLMKFVNVNQEFYQSQNHVLEKLTENVKNLDMNNKTMANTIKNLATEFKPIINNLKVTESNIKNKKGIK